LTVVARVVFGHLDIGVTQVAYRKGARLLPLAKSSASQNLKFGDAQGDRGRSWNKAEELLSDHPNFKKTVVSSGELGNADHELPLHVTSAIISENTLHLCPT
jgi:hypothetical protein